MNIERRILLGLLFVSGGVLQLGSAGALRAESNDTGRPGASVVTQFTVADKIQVPGKTLSSGNYTLRMVDHLRDRMILRVEKDGKTQSTFLALPNSRLSKTGAGPITLGTGSKLAMRGFAFPGGTVAEFVYPKSDAVKLAKDNDTTIPAIDPDSEGRPPANGLSQDDLEEITLWLLTPTEVGPQFGGTGIKVARYHAPATPTQVMPSQQAAPVQQAVAPRSVMSQTAPQQEVANLQLPPRPKARRPLMTALPHTASEMPLLALVGLMSLVGAGLLTRRRLKVVC